MCSALYKIESKRRMGRLPPRPEQRSNFKLKPSKGVTSVAIFVLDDVSTVNLFSFCKCYLCCSLGPGLGFVAYPEGLAQMPAASVWAVMFFFMLFTIGMGSQVRQSLFNLSLTPFDHLLILSLRTLLP